MRGFEKFILIIFSIIVIILSVFFILFSTEMISIDYITKIIEAWVVANRGIVIITSTIFALLGLVGMFSSSESADEKKGGLAIKNDTGVVYITKDTFESIIVGITKNYAEIRNVKVDILVSEKGVISNVYVMILPDTIVPTLTSKLQENIKSSVLKQTTVEISEVNIKVRGVYEENLKK